MSKSAFCFETLYINKFLCRLASSARHVIYMFLVSGCMKNLARHFSHLWKFNFEKNKKAGVESKIPNVFRKIRTISNLLIYTRSGRGGGEEIFEFENHIVSKFNYWNNKQRTYREKKIISRPAWSFPHGILNPQKLSFLEYSCRTHIYDIYWPYLSKHHFGYDSRPLCVKFILISAEVILSVFLGQNLLWKNS